MNLAKAKEYYSLGILTAFHAVPNDEGWILSIESKANAYGHTLKTALGEEKFYMSLDSLNRDVERIVGSAQAWSMAL